MACLIGKLIACLPASRYGALYYRNLEQDKILDFACAHIPGIDNVASDLESRKEYKQA